MTQADQPPPPAPKPLPAPDPLAAEITQTLLALDAEENNTHFGDLLEQQARSGAETTPPQAGAPARLDLSGILDQPDLQASLTGLLIEKFKLPKLLAELLAEAILSKTAKKKPRSKPRRKKTVAQPKRPAAAKPHRKPKTTAAAKKKPAVKKKPVVKKKPS